MKFTQKICLFCLSFAVLFSGSVSIFSVHAEDTTDLTSSQPGGGTSISAETVIIPSPNYAISIPAGIALGDIAKTEETSVKSAAFTVGVSNFSNLDGKQVKVTLSTPYSGFYLYSGDHVLPYQVFSTATEGEGTAIAMNGTFYTFTAAGQVTGRVEVDQFHIPAEGEYGGILNFTFQVEDTPTQ